MDEQSLIQPTAIFITFCDDSLHLTFSPVCTICDPLPATLPAVKPLQYQQGGLPMLRFLLCVGFAHDAIVTVASLFGEHGKQDTALLTRRQKMPLSVFSSNVQVRFSLFESSFFWCA